MRPNDAGLEPGALGSDVALRAAGPDDAARVYRWHANAFRWHIERLWGWDEAWQRRDCAALFAALPPLIVCVPGRACGFIQTQRRRRALHLVNIALDEAVRDRGIGTRLIAALQRRAAAGGLAVTLKVFRTNVRAEALYARLGFVRCGTTDTHQRMRWRAAATLDAPRG